MGYPVMTLFLFYLAPLLLVTMILAALPWGKPRVRIVLLSGHLAGSVLAALLLPDIRVVWICALLPGSVTAALRIISAIFDIRRSERVAAQNRLSVDEYGEEGR